MVEIEIDGDMVEIKINGVPEKNTIDYEIASREKEVGEKTIGVSEVETMKEAIGMGIGEEGLEWVSTRKEYGYSGLLNE
ncbi:hypothetical protein L1987_00795 [Smallanthus sonchifolius]|uniref:Uncharacterized protein n=1 Tax=Smallanthus sonchifolius TaxID=185202 RepID=A0ACB9K3B5_9ASTR|nr:hypothetical protein L1987_00795 [Smallanthus sonchifolius]